MAELNSEFSKVICIIRHPCIEQHRCTCKAPFLHRYRYLCCSPVSVRILKRLHKQKRNSYFEWKQKAERASALIIMNWFLFYAIVFIGLRGSHCVACRPNVKQHRNTTSLLICICAFPQINYQRGSRSWRWTLNATIQRGHLLWR